MISFIICPLYFIAPFCLSIFFQLFLIVCIFLVSRSIKAYSFICCDDYDWKSESFHNCCEAFTSLFYFIRTWHITGHLHNTRDLLTFRNMEIPLPLVAPNWIWFYLKLRRWKIGRIDAWINLECWSKMEIRYFMHWRRFWF